jgi:hypothetical protein
MIVPSVRRLVSAMGACLIAMGTTMTVMAPPASAATVNITIPSVSGAQPVSLLDTDGITFSGTFARTCILTYASSLIYVVGTASTWCAGVTGSANNALTINVPGGEGITFSWSRGGLTAVPFSLTFKLAGVTVSSEDIPDTGSSPVTRNLAFDTVVITAKAGMDVYISSMSITYDSTSPSSAIDAPPTVPIQGVPLPASGQCSDVVESRLDWATDISGGWSRSWQSWQVSSDANAPRWEGWACIRTLIWSSRGWVPSSA